MEKISLPRREFSKAIGPERNFHRHGFFPVFCRRNFLFLQERRVLGSARAFALILSRASLILEKWEIPAEAPFYGTGISVCQFSPFPPAATDCEMKFYIKLRLSSLLSPPSSPFLRAPPPPLFPPARPPVAHPSRPLYIYVPIDRYVGVCIYIDTVTPPTKMPNI